MIPIENEKRVDWNAIRAEYIGGNISQTNLAKKYGLCLRTVQDRVKREGWVEARQKACAKSISETCKKTAEVAADNATIAARLKRKMLLRLEREFDALPDSIGSEKHMDISNFEYDGKKLKKRTEGGTRYKLSDFAKAFKDLTDDMPAAQASNELLQSLMELERRAGQ